MQKRKFLKFRKIDTSKIYNDDIFGHVKDIDFSV